MTGCLGLHSGLSRVKAHGQTDSVGTRTSEHTHAFNPANQRTVEMLLWDVIQRIKIYRNLNIWITVNSFFGTINHNPISKDSLYIKKQKNPKKPNMLIS